MPWVMWLKLIQVKVQLPHSIPMEVVDFDLEKELFIKGYVNGNEEEETVYKLTMMQRLLKVMEPRCDCAT